MVTLAWLLLLPLISCILHLSRKKAEFPYRLHRHNQHIFFYPHTWRSLPRRNLDIRITSRSVDIYMYIYIHMYISYLILDYMIKHISPTRLVSSGCCHCHCVTR
jgi:hypothetical protein